MHLSIIIPVYNVEAYVGRTLKSVFDTVVSPTDFEVIVINDGTRDGSMRIVRQYADRPNITILEQENQGLSAARMNGLAVAKGDYVWFVDSDDWLVKDGVGKVLGLLEERSDADVLMFPVKWAYEDPSRDFLDYHVDYGKTVSGKAVMRDLQLPPWLVQRFVFRRSLTDYPQLFFPKGLLHEDNYFCPVLLCMAKNVSVFDYPVYYYLIRPGSIKTSRIMQSPYDLVSIHKLLMQYMRRNLPHKDWQWFKVCCFNQLKAAYIDNVSLFRTMPFKRFCRSNGLYVWKQWKGAYPEKTLRKKAGKMLYYLVPAICRRLARA